MEGALIADGGGRGTGGAHLRGPIFFLISLKHLRREMALIKAAGEKTVLFLELHPFVAYASLSYVS